MEVTSSPATQSKSDQQSRRSGAPALFRGTAAYAAATVAARAIGFVLLPLYARVLSPGEYGQVAVITAISSALGAVVGFGLETAVFRARAQHAAASEFDDFMRGVGLFAVGAPMFVAAAAALLIAQPLADLFQVPAAGIQVAFVGSALFASATAFPLAILRAEERLRDYVTLSGLHVVLGTAATLGLVVWLRWGVVGWMLAIALASGGLLFGGLAILRPRWRLGYDRTVLVQALGLGLPLVPHALAHWTLSLSDRAVLGAFVDPAQTGAYYVAYQLTLPISVMAIAVSRSLQPLYAQASASTTNRRRMGTGAATQALVILLLGVATASVGPTFIGSVLPESYGEAGIYLPTLSIGIAFFGLSLIPTDVVSLTAGRTHWMWTVTVLAALVNIGLNLIFVPTVGPYAAAVSTAVSYAVLLVGGVLLAWRIPTARFQVPWRYFTSGLAIIGATAVGATLVGGPSLDGLIAKSAVIAGGGLLLILAARTHLRD